MAIRDETGARVVITNTDYIKQHLCIEYERCICKHYLRDVMISSGFHKSWAHFMNNRELFRKILQHVITWHPEPSHHRFT